MIDITEAQFNVVRKILDEHLPDVEVWVFGSRVKGTAKCYSDLDLAFITKAPLTLYQQTFLELAFSDSDLPFRVDCLDWSSCSESFKQIVLQKYEILPKTYPLS